MPTTTTPLRERFEIALMVVDQHAEVVEFVGDPDGMQTVADALGDAIDLLKQRDDLLEALRYIVDWNATDWDAEKARDMARAAIAKATR